MLRIILFLLKCVVGLFAAVGFLVAVGAVAAVIFVPRFHGFQPAAPEVPEQTVLVLDLADGVIEQRPDNPLARASLGGAMILHQAVTALEAAGRDPRVKGLVVRAGWGSPGHAQMQELRAAVAEFRAQGKPVVAFAETFGEAGDGTLHYYLASAADEVWMQPSGELDITGFAIQQPFLESLLTDIGVQSQFGQREEFKGAMSLFTEDNMPEPQRENLQRYVDSALSQVVAAVAEARALEPGALRDLIDRAPHRAEEALDLGLVDRLGYWDQVEDSTGDLMGTDAMPLSLRDYAVATAPQDGDDPVIALVVGQGPIVLAESENDPVFGTVAMGAVDIRQALADAIDDPGISAVVFRVDSPGGSYVASDTIWRELQRARELDKPVVVSMGNVAASGGYFVAAAAEAIVAQPATLTGSIGVVSGKFSLQEMWQDLGVNWDSVRAGRRAEMWSPNAPFSRDEWEWLQRNLDATYADFTGKVAAGRNLSREEILTVAKGQIWSGADARNAGLVDELGGYAKAIGLAKAAAGIPEDIAVQLRPFPEERDGLLALFEDILGGEIESPATRALLRNLLRLAQAVVPLVETMERLTGDPRSHAVQLPHAVPAG